MRHDHDKAPADRGRLDPDRLLDAADVILAAWDRGSDGATLIDVWMDDADAAPTDHFTCEEYINSMHFLVRLGLISTTDARWLSAHRSHRP